MFQRGAACFVAKGSPCMFVEDEMERRDNIVDGFIVRLNIYSKVVAEDIASVNPGALLTYDECRGWS